MQTTLKEEGITRVQAKRMVGGGWSKLINEFYRRKSEGCIVSDVKEKYGTLRIYQSGAEEDLDLELEIMKRSSKVCEKCGAKGKLRDDLSWILTLCDEHYKAKDL